VRNTGTETLRDVQLTLSAGPDGVKVTDADAGIGDLPGGESADGRFAFIVESSGCFEFVGLGGEATYDGGSSPLKVAIPAACPGPRLSLRDVTFAGGDGDGIPEPGETLRVSFELVNQGRDVARNVRASVKISGDGLTATGTDLQWPDIEPNGSARNTQPLILSVSPDAKTQESCENLPQPLPFPVEDPAVAVDGGPLPPDTAVSSDGNVSSGTGSSGAPGIEPSGGGSDQSGGQSVPGSTGSGGSTGNGTEPGTIEPDPVPPEKSAEPGPRPIEPAPEPEPAPDQPVQMQALLTISADDHENAAEWTNQTFCTMELGAPTDAALAARGASDEAAATGGAALPVSAALGISAMAVIAHRRLVG
jgi:hypothetical protein